MPSPSTPSPRRGERHETRATPTGSVFAQEMGHFAGTLDPVQRTFLQRLLGEFLTAIPPDDDMPDGVAMVREASGDLRALLGHLRQYDGHDSDFQPFQIAFPASGAITVRVNPRIATWTGFAEERAVSWAKGPHAGMITFDLAHLPEVTSTTLAWMLQVAQGCPAGHVWLSNCSPTVRRSIEILHVGRLLRVMGDASAMGPMLSMR